jgi:hypothetical protein
MRFKISGLKSQIVRLLLCFSVALPLFLGFHFNLPSSPLHPFTISPSVAFSAEKWPGVDESVVEKFAKEHGREAREPFINTDQGDLLLFVFLLAGAVGGFTAGYYWRSLIESRSRKSEERVQVTENK